MKQPCPTGCLKVNHFPDDFRFHAGEYISNLVYWIQEHFGFVLDAVGKFVLRILMDIQTFLLWIPWPIVVLLVFLLGWRLRTLWSGITFAVMLIIIGSFGLWDHMMDTSAVVLTSVVIALVVGIPAGILMTYSRKFEYIMKPTLDFMQTMPAFVYLIPAMIFFGLGPVPAVFATLVYSAPPIIRLTDLAIRGVSKEMVEAAQSFGSSRWQLLKKVQLPQAWPTIITGANQTTMMALAMVVIASMVGASGLGMDVLKAINHIDIANGFEAGVSIVFLAIIIDRITIGISDRFDTRRGKGVKK